MRRDRRERIFQTENKQSHCNRFLRTDLDQLRNVKFTSREYIGHSTYITWNDWFITDVNLKTNSPHVTEIRSLMLQSVIYWSSVLRNLYFRRRIIPHKGILSLGSDYALVLLQPVQQHCCLTCFRAPVPFPIISVLLNSQYSWNLKAKYML